MPARKLLNLALHWMMEHTDGEVWEREFRHKFFPDPDAPERHRVAPSKLAEAKPGVEGSLNIKRVAEPVKVTNEDLEKFFGRAGSPGKSDPNKAVIAAKARAKAQKPSIKIAPDAEGNLSVDAPDG